MIFLFKSFIHIVPYKHSCLQIISCVPGLHIDESVSKLNQFSVNFVGIASIIGASPQEESCCMLNFGHA